MFSITVKGLDKMIRSIDAIIAELRIQEEELPKQCAIQLSMDIVKNITTQAFAPYASYNKKYKSWKKSAFGHLRFWELYGDLIGSISAFLSTGGGWEAGIVPGSLNREGKAVAWYADINEGGGTFMYTSPSTNKSVKMAFPARPLFGPSRKKFMAETWPVLGKKSLAKVGARWSGK